MTEMVSIKHQAEIKNKEELEKRLVSCYQGLLNKKKDLDEAFAEFEKNPEKYVDRQNNTSVNAWNTTTIG